MGLGIALGPKYEVGESSAAAAARPAGGLRADYGFVATHGQGELIAVLRSDPDLNGAKLFDLKNYKIKLNN
ncbi:hypothetical protein Tco_0101620 [Tanacetum coccineum]